MACAGDLKQAKNWLAQSIFPCVACACHIFYRQHYRRQSEGFDKGLRLLRELWDPYKHMSTTM